MRSWRVCADRIGRPTRPIDRSCGEQVATPRRTASSGLPGASPAGGSIHPKAQKLERVAEFFGRSPRPKALKTPKKLTWRELVLLSDQDDASVVLTQPHIFGVKPLKIADIMRNEHEPLRCGKREVIPVGPPEKASVPGCKHEKTVAPKRLKAIRVARVFVEVEPQVHLRMDLAAADLSHAPAPGDRTVRLRPLCSRRSSLCSNGSRPARHIAAPR